MDVKRGYKQAEGGVIPEDWEIASIGSVASFKSGEGISIAALAEESPDAPIPVYGGNGIAGYTHSALVRESVVVIGRVGQKCGEVYLTGGPAWITDNALYPRSLLRKVDVRFLALALKFAGLNNVKNRNDLPLVTQSILHSVRIPLPATQAEEEAIAEALSDADALIVTLEQLLGKKRQLKQGAMQELLSGKRRLPGFRGEWEMKRLEELGRWTGGMTPSMRNQDYWEIGTVPWISSGDVKSPRLMSTAFAISEYAVKRRAATLLPAKSIIVVTRSGILRKFLPVSMNMIPMAINQDIKALLPNQLVLAEYLLHSLTRNGDQILSSCLKSGTTVESIEFPWLKAFTIPIPPLPEQTAIATILSDMDAEIIALEAKLDKARQIKQGMMQELLTGRIRLV